MRLPVLETKALSSATDGGGEWAAPSPTPYRRVLIVDDNMDGADMLAMLLRAEGHEVHAAYDGPTGLAAALEFQPQIVLLDIGLPRMDGYEVARRLRKQEGLRNVYLVALTGYGQEEDRRMAMEAGFDAHLVKPADPAVLQGVLAQSRS